MVNKYFNNQNHREQELLNSLVDESINIHGDEFRYIPRILSATMNLNIFNEDRLSIFKHSYPITAYLENPSEGMTNNGYLLQKFGGMIDYSVTVTISHNEWSRSVGQFGKTNIPDRPNEGDLLYYPVTDSLYEIKFVDDKTQPFAQFGRNYSYRCTCELFQYSSEHIDTRDGEVNVFEGIHTLNVDPDRSLNGGLVEVQINKRGKGYTEIPQLVIHSLTGSGAEVLITISDEDGGIDAIQVIDPGMTYHSSDTAEIVGDCEESAEVLPIFRTIIEHSGEGYGSNAAFISNKREIVPEELNWNSNDPFNESPTMNPFGIDEDGR